MTSPPPTQEPPPTEPGSSSDDADNAVWVGKTVGKYEIVRLLGRGGMGSVYEALNTGIGKRVAMKFVDADTAKNKDAVARFQREAQAASAVESAHIVEIFDSGTTDSGEPFIVMELLRGEDLGHRIKRLGRLEVPEALHITAQILRGLHRAHAAGIVHRDLKPDNIFLVDRDDDPTFAKILDFGISKVQRTSELSPRTITREGTVLGTPFYMAPEQAQAAPDIDGRADLWAAGAILYECLTGRPPHVGTTYEQVIIAICTKEAEDIRLHNPIISEGLSQVVQKALHRDRKERFATAREFLETLIEHSGGALSVRHSRGVSDDAHGGSRRDSSLTPSSPGKTPAPKVSSGAAFDPTVEVAGGGPSKVGWSTQRRLEQEDARRSSRNRLVVVAVALLLGIVGGAFWLRPSAENPSPAAVSATVSADTEQVHLKLSSNVPGARFLVDGVQAGDATVHGVRGQKRAVRVEADGFAPASVDVVLDPSVSSMLIPLSAALGTAENSARVTPEAPAESAAPKSKHAGTPASSSKKPAASATPETTAAPTASSPPKPSSGGVANGLSLQPH